MGRRVLVRRRPRTGGGDYFQTATLVAEAAGLSCRAAFSAAAFVTATDRILNPYVSDPRRRPRNDDLKNLVSLPGRLGAFGSEPTGPDPIREHHPRPSSRRPDFVGHEDDLPTKESAGRRHRTGPILELPPRPRRPDRRSGL